MSSKATKRHPLHYVIMTAAFAWSVIPVLMCCVTGPVFMNIAPVVFLTGIFTISGVGQILDELHDKAQRHPANKAAAAAEEARKSKAA